MQARKSYLNLTGTNCRNLMPDTDGCLVPTDGPATIAMPQGYRPVANFGGQIIGLKDSTLAIIRRGTPLTSLQLTDLPEKIDVVGNRLCARMSDGSQQYVGVDIEAGTLRPCSFGECSSLPSPVIRFTYEGPHTADIPAVPLSKQWATTRILSAADRANLADAARTALRRLDDDIRRSGHLIHPMLVMTRIRDAEGRLVYESAPTLFRAPGGADFPARIQLMPDTVLGASQPSTISAEVYSMWLDADMTAWAENYSGGTIEVLAWPSMPTIDVDARPDVYGRQRADENYLCNVIFAKGRTAYGDQLNQLAVMQIMQLADDSHLHVVYSRRIAAENLSCEVPLTATATVKASQPVNSRSPVPLFYPAQPHRFSAAAQAVSADTILSADLTVCRARPADISSLVQSSSVSAAVWHGYTAVEFADGTVAVNSTNLSSGPPETFKPMLSYPAPDAVAITVAWTSPSAGHFKARYPLVVDGSGRRSCHISPTGLPFALPRSTDVFAVPTDTCALLRFPDRLVAADYNSPRVPVARGVIPAGTLITVLPETSPQQSWDFGRHRFRAFTSAGIYTVNVDRAKGKISFALVDRRILPSSSHAIATPQGIAAVLDGSLILYCGSKTTVLATDAGERLPVWCAEHGGEIWLAGQEDTAVVRIGTEGITYMLDKTFEPSAGGTLLRSENGWHIAGHDSPTAMIDITLQGAIEATTAFPGALRTLTLDARGVFDNLQLSVARSHLNHPAPGPDLRLVLKGTLRSPLIRRFITPPAGQYRLTLSGQVSRQTRIKGLRIDLA